MQVLFDFFLIGKTVKTSMMVADKMPYLPIGPIGPNRPTGHLAIMTIKTLRLKDH